MNFLARLRAMFHLSEATTLVAASSHRATIEAEDQARVARLGDIEGQTARAQAFAAELRGSVTGS